MMFLPPFMISCLILLDWVVRLAGINVGLLAILLLLHFFFFQAEDGIRDDLVTGVQTCALPIFERELIAFCRAQIAHYKCPRTIDFARDVPRTETGKMAKRLLREKYWAGRGSRLDRKSVV